MQVLRVALFSWFSWIMVVWCGVKKSCIKSAAWDWCLLCDSGSGGGSGHSNLIAQPRLKILVEILGDDGDTLYTNPPHNSTVTAIKMAILQTPMYENNTQRRFLMSCFPTDLFDDD